MSFYGSELGGRLIAEENYPDSIRDFLEKEYLFLFEAIAEHDLIVEVGCMEGRYCKAILERNINYVGIDLSQEYISRANALFAERMQICQYEFLCLDAEHLDVIARESRLFDKANAPLVFFPFNSFGNMRNIKNVLASISRINGATFYIFTYDVDTAASNERKTYYSNCNYSDLQLVQSDCSVRFVSPDGLDCAAYTPAFIADLCRSLSLNIEFHRFSQIGIVYQITT